MNSQSYAWLKSKNAVKFSVFLGSLALLSVSYDPQIAQAQSCSPTNPACGAGTPQGGGGGGAGVGVSVDPIKVINGIGGLFGHKKKKVEPTPVPVPQPTVKPTPVVVEPVKPKIIYKSNTQPTVIVQTPKPKVVATISKPRPYVPPVKVSPKATPRVSLAKPKSRASAPKIVAVTATTSVIVPNVATPAPVVTPQVTAPPAPTPAIVEQPAPASAPAPVIVQKTDGSGTMDGSLIAKILAGIAALGAAAFVAKSYFAPKPSLTVNCAIKTGAMRMEVETKSFLTLSSMDRFTNDATA